MFVSLFFLSLSFLSLSFLFVFSFRSDPIELDFKEIFYLVTNPPHSHRPFLDHVFYFFMENDFFKSTHPTKVWFFLVVWHFLEWKNNCFQNCSKLPKNHLEQQKFQSFPHILVIVRGGWVWPNLENSRFFLVLMEPFPHQTSPFKVTETICFNAYQKTEIFW